jgi:hypothetical protein
MFFVIHIAIQISMTVILIMHKMIKVKIMFIYVCDMDVNTLYIDILAKNNPKLNEKPRGGNSFQRIDSL